MRALRLCVRTLGDFQVEYQNNHYNFKIFIVFTMVMLLSLISINITFKYINKNIYIDKSKIIKALLLNKLDSQMKITVDWAIWEDTVDFIEKNNLNYIKSNINSETLKNLDLDFMIFFNKYKNTHYAYFIKNGDHLDNNDNIFILKLKTKFYGYLSTGTSLHKLKTFAKINRQIYMLTIHPILKAYGQSFAYGTIIFGRKISNDFFKKIGKIIDSHIKILKFSNPTNKHFIVNKNSVIISFSNNKNEFVFAFKAIFPENKYLFYLELFIYLLVFVIISVIFILLFRFSKKEEFKIKSELKLLYQAMEQSKTGIILTRFNGEILYVNNIISEITGFSKKELIGKQLTKLLDNKILTDIFNKKLKNGEYWKGEIKGKNKTGKTVELEINISPVIGKTGKIDIFVTTCEFISDKKKLIKELDAAKKEAEYINKLKMAILFNMSHEIKTPLTGIVGFLQLLETTDLTEKQKEYINHLKVSYKKLNDFFDKLIDFSKIEADLYEIEPEPFEISKLNKEITDKFKPLINKKGLAFKYFLDKNIPKTIVGCKKLLEKTLNLILENAVKFTEKGVITYECKLMEKNNSMITICFIIKDTGIGINKKKLDKIFDYFVQGNSSMNRKHEGLGMGLTLAKKFIEKTGGKIYLDSKEGEGSEFRIIVKVEEYKN